LVDLFESYEQIIFLYIGMAPS